MDQTTPQPQPAATQQDALLRRMDLWWRAANYISVCISMSGLAPRLRRR